MDGEKNGLIDIEGVKVAGGRRVQTVRPSRSITVVCQL